MNNELGKCVQFLLENGWRKDNEDGEACEFDSYSKGECIGVDISEKEMVFISGGGDFLSLPLNYFSLIGVLIEYHQITFDYVSTRFIN